MTPEQAVAQRWEALLQLTRWAYLVSPYWEARRRRHVLEQFRSANGPRCLLIRSNTTAFRAPGRGGRERVIRANLPGTPDYTGVIAPTGQWLGVEIKAEGGTLSDDQALYGDVLRSAGGVWLWGFDEAVLMERLGLAVGAVRAT